MIIAQTQNNAFVNLTNFSVLYIDMDNDEHIFITDGTHILGYYPDMKSAMQVLSWMIKSIDKKKLRKNLIIQMPILNTY